MAQSENTTPGKAGKMRGWIKLLFGLSLSLNLLVVAAIGSAVWRGGRAGGEEGRASVPAVMPLIRALSHRDRMALRHGLMQAGAGAGPGAEPRQGDSEAGPAAGREGAILLVLRQEPFDAPRLESLLLNHAVRSQRRAQVGAATLARLIAGMSTTERAEYVTEVEQLFARRGRRHQHR